MATDLLDTIYGCLAGAAVGDALGAPVEGRNYWEIQEQYGRLDELIASSVHNTNGLPGGVTAGTALRQYVGLAIVRKQGRVSPDDLATLWLEKGSSARFGSNERAVHGKLSLGANPWDSGRAGNPSSSAAMAVVPVGIINAADPAQAYQDGYALASILQDGHERDTAAALAAGVAAAVVPGSTLADVMAAMSQAGTSLVRRAIELTLDLAVVSGTMEEFTRRYYAQMADWRVPQPPDREDLLPDGAPLRARYRSSSGLECIPVALALLHLCRGDVNDCIVAGVNFGRNPNGIASIVGCILGAQKGATQIRRDWIETCEEANRDLFEALEDDPTAGFYSMAWRLVKALKAERQTIENRLKKLDKLLGQ